MDRMSVNEMMEYVKKRAEEICEGFVFGKTDYRKFAEMVIDKIASRVGKVAKDCLSAEYESAGNFVIAFDTAKFFTYLVNIGLYKPPLPDLIQIELKRREDIENGGQ